MPLGSRRNLPSYIPSKNFAGALVDVIFGSDPNKANQPLSPANLKAAAESITNNPKLRQALLSAIESAGTDIEAVKKNLAAWYDSAMDRVSGWYKRRTQLILFFMGLFAAIVLNVDAITTFVTLQRNPTMSAALLEQAKKIKDVKSVDLTAVQKEFVAVSFPMGWKSGRPGPQFAVCPLDVNGEYICAGKSAIAIWFRTAVGWLITALAVMLGAPFWFDVLAKFMSIRATGKPIEDGTSKPKGGGGGTEAKTTPGTGN